MELRLELKICEGCGCLWYRIQDLETVYCRGCEIRFREFPAPTNQRRRRAPRRKLPFGLERAACSIGGGQ